MLNAYERCNLCPRKCLVNRLNGQIGFCKETAELKIACAMKHFGEEPPVTAIGGSGTIFVTGCNLHCAFCQNYQISQRGMGKFISIDEGVELCLKLQESNSENINFVTGSHAIPTIATIIEKAKLQGLKIPVCWNTSSYENIESLEMLSGLVDIWLPDLKTLNPRIAQSVFQAPDYPSVAKKAIRWMINHTENKFVALDKPTEISEYQNTTSILEKMISGVIVRHLVLPGRLGDTEIVLKWLKDNADEKACISLMSQYTPVNFEDNNFTQKTERENSLKAFQNRLLTKKEFDEIQKLISIYDFSYLFYQELDDDTGWLPDFSRPQPFSATLAHPVWHWNN
ncbi:MAG: radical SAM protein [Treponema sp.]|nr:radical SAM protein [Treponema sp.]